MKKNKTYDDESIKALLNKHLINTKSIRLKAHLDRYTPAAGQATIRTWTSPSLAAKTTLHADHQFVGCHICSGNTL